MNPKTYDFEKWLRWSVIATTILALTFFVRVVRVYLASRASGLDIDWNVPTNPQSMIALCLVIATLSLWFLRDIGKGLAILLFAVVLGFFGYWAYLTQQIKINTSLESIPQASWIGNLWIGASLVDLSVLTLTVTMLAFDCWLLFRRKRAFTRHVPNLHPSHT